MVNDRLGSSAQSSEFFSSNAFAAFTRIDPRLVQKSLASDAAVVTAQKTSATEKDDSMLETLVTTKEMGEEVGVLMVQTGIAIIGGRSFVDGYALNDSGNE